MDGMLNDLVSEILSGSISLPESPYEEAQAA
jgi:hypothetical protein